MIWTHPTKLSKEEETIVNKPNLYRIEPFSIKTSTTHLNNKNPLLSIVAK
jgi:hypothetical protein